MEFKEITPSLALQPYVRNYWLFDVNEGDLPFSQLLFPFGSFELIFNLLNAPQMRMHGQKSSFLQPDNLFPGQFTKPFVLDFMQSTRCIGVSLQPWMGNFLFNIPAQEFTDRVTDVQSIDDKNRLTHKLRDAKSETVLIKQLEEHLLGKLKNCNIDSVATHIARTIIQSPATYEFKNILISIGLTRRRIEQRFLEATGLPMGFFVRKVRFQKAVNLLRYEKNLSLSQIGLDAGYYDQAHFIREFKEFSGVTPKEFLNQISEMKNFVSDLMMVG
jgi:AraC-like DNA-binding protein